MRDEKLYLIHIRECIEHVVEYTADGKAEFLTNRMVQDAVLRNLQLPPKDSRMN